MSERGAAAGGPGLGCTVLIADPARLPPLKLAYIGDGVLELLLRERALAEGETPLSRLHSAVTAKVCAEAQSEALERVLPHLSPEEDAVFHRGRNAKASAPRHCDVAEYRRATGLEALFGYLHLAGKKERVYELFCLAYPPKGADEKSPG